MLNSVMSHATSVDSQESQSEEEVVVEKIGKRYRTRKERHCQYCSRSFSKTEHLLRHERSHTKEKPFRCNTCNKVYRRRDTMLRHCKLQHNDLPQMQSDQPWTQESRESTSSSRPDQSNLVDLMMPPLQGNLATNIELLDNWQNGTANPSTDSAVQGAYQVEQVTFPSNDPTGDSNQNQQEPTVAPVLEPGHEATDSANLDPAVARNFSEALQIPTYDFWGASSFSPGPSWLNGFDFDLQALNTSVTATMDITEPLFQQTPPSVLNERATDPMSQNKPQQKRRLVNDNVRRGWFSHLNRREDDDDNVLASGQSTPVNTALRCDIGDNFRYRISKRLEPQVIDEPLPSTNFLNQSVRVYFTKFSPIFPVIHGQTFRPSPKNSLLLLSITSVGSLLLGSKRAATQGTRIFERLNKAILASWEKILVSDTTEAVSMVQAALIGQTFGFLSGAAEHLAIVESFHGTVIAWARKCGMFKCKEDRPELEHLSGIELEDAWKRWARSEEIIRTIMGLYIHDAMLASLFHHEPLLRHNLVQLPVAADDDVFNASTAEIWRQQMLIRSPLRLPVRNFLRPTLFNDRLSAKQPQLKENYFTAYFALYTILTTVSEHQQMQTLTPNSLDFNNALETLIGWHQIFQDDVVQLDSNNNPRSDPLCLISLWHAVFMSLFTNFDLLEQAVGRDNEDDVTTDIALSYAAEWANSVESERCILHIQALLKCIGAMRLDAEPAIHIPHCLFLAGIASYCFERFRQRPPPSTTVNSAQDNRDKANLTTQNFAIVYPEFVLRGTHTLSNLLGTTTNSPSSVDYMNIENTSSQSVSTNPISDMASGMLYTIMDILQRIGHWNVAQRYASTLSTLISTDGPDEMSIMNTSQDR